MQSHDQKGDIHKYQTMWETPFHLVKWSISPMESASFRAVGQGGYKEAKISNSTEKKAILKWKGKQRSVCARAHTGTQRERQTLLFCIWQIITEHSAKWGTFFPKSCCCYTFGRPKQPLRGSRCRAWKSGYHTRALSRRQKRESWATVV